MYLFQWCGDSSCGYGHAKCSTTELYPGDFLTRICLEFFTIMKRESTFAEIEVIQEGKKQNAARKTGWLTEQYKRLGISTYFSLKQFLKENSLSYQSLIYAFLKLLLPRNQGRYKCTYTEPGRNPSPALTKTYIINRHQELIQIQAHSFFLLLYILCIWNYFKFYNGNNLP